MNTLLRERCLFHPGREAVARCPECRGFFCRECVTEHDEKVVCANCLARLAAAVPRPISGRGVATLFRWGGAVAGLLVAWFCFYTIGRVLIAIPSDFHASKLWHRPSTMEVVR